MAINFEDIPCEAEQKAEPPRVGPTVADELNARLELLVNRANKCKAIKPIAKHKNPDLLHAYKFKCYCPQYHPCYPCQHTGQIIIDRDVLTKEEHICYLATPKKNLGAPRKPPRYYHKKVVIPNCTARIKKLAEPDLNRVKETLKKFKNKLSDRCANALKSYLAMKPPVEAMTLSEALEYLEEEQRLKRVARQLQRRRCRGLKKRILSKQRRQIRKIICVLFEEMKDFLLNDQFIIDERSPLCAVILEQIQNFTDKEFYTTSNLREYQRVLANNITVWINKFISNLNIHLAPPPQQMQQQPPDDVCPPLEDPETFIPVWDYISATETDEEEHYAPDDEYQEHALEDYNEMYEKSDVTLKNTDTNLEDDTN